MTSHDDESCEAMAGWEAGGVLVGAHETSTKRGPGLHHDCAASYSTVLVDAPVDRFRAVHL